MYNFHPPEVVGRGSETQLQVGEYFNYSICKDNISGVFSKGSVKVSNSYFPRAGQIVLYETLVIFS